MKSEGAVQYKLKQVCYRHRKKEIEKILRPCPQNCIHNDKPGYPKDTEESKRIPLYRVCFYDEDGAWRGVVCDEEVGGSLLAKRCPYFEPEKSAEEIKEEFGEFLRTAEIGDIAVRYPDIAALMWVLDLAPGFVMEEDEQQEPPPDNVPPTE